MGSHHQTHTHTHTYTHSVTFHQTQVNTPRVCQMQINSLTYLLTYLLNPSQTDRYSIYLPDTSEHTPRLSDANKLTYLLTYLLT